MGSTTNDQQNLSLSLFLSLQVLLHQKGDIPVMQGRAFAISPGLYTMVAVEKTEVRSQRTYCQTFSKPVMHQ